MRPLHQTAKPRPRKHWAPRPKRHFIPWLDFIIKDSSVPAIVEARNNGGGIAQGQRYTCWDFEGNYFAIWNQAGNQVWCHKNNLRLLAKGTVQTLQHCTYVPKVSSDPSLAQARRALF